MEDIFLTFKCNGGGNDNNNLAMRNYLCDSIVFLEQMFWNKRLEVTLPS